MRSRAENISMIVVLVIVLLGAAWYFRPSVLRSGSDSTPTATSSAASASPSGSASPSPSASASASASPSAGAAVVGKGAKVAFIGDSFAAGNGASAPDKRWTSLLSAAQGWSEDNQAHPQSGYVVSGTTGDCSPQTCPSFPDAVTKLAGSGAQLVIVSGGANDLTKDPAEVATAVTSTLTAIHTSVPDAKIVVLDPWWDMRPTDDRLTAVTTAIKDAATADGATWIDVGQPIAGKSADFAADGFSPNDEGQAALAKAVTQGLAQAGIIAS